MQRAEYTGHGQNTGGLQMHSIGDDYPFMVVGTQHRYPAAPQFTQTKETRYYVQNLVTGEKFYHKDWFGNGMAQTWSNIRDAHLAIGWIKHGHMTSIVAVG